MICNDCQGEKYARRCRSLPEMRRANDIPEVCPFGLPLLAAPVTSVYRGSDACEHLLIVPTGGCCDSEVFCDWGERRPLTSKEAIACRT